MISKPSSLHVLRGVLRRLNGDGPTRKYVMEQYRLHQSAQGEQAEALQDLAYNYFALLRDLKERARLHEIDAGAEVKLSPKEMSRRAAARAGLQLPDLDPNLK